MPFWILFFLPACSRANEVRPDFNLSRRNLHFNTPLVDSYVDEVTFLKTCKAIVSQRRMCLSETDKSTHYKNKMKHHQYDYKPNLFTTTFWGNEFVQIGHVFYDLVMLEALQHVRIDRIAFQRAICASSGGCVGLGAIDGFYSGYLAAVLAAANKSHIPVYFRWGWRDKELRPLYFSPVSPTLYSGATPPPTDLPSIKIEQTMCFERVLRSEPTSFGAVPSISTGTASRQEGSLHASRSPAHSRDPTDKIAPHHPSLLPQGQATPPLADSQTRRRCFLSSKRVFHRQLTTSFS